MLDGTKILIVDKLVLMHRNQSPKIYMRYKHPKTGQWLFMSTKTTDVDIAEHFARTKFSEIELKVANNIPTASYSMKKLIEAYLKELKAEYQRGTEISDSNYSAKVRITNKFVRPFFEDRLLHTIDANVIQEFAAWRRDYWLNQPDDAVIEYERKNGAVLSRPVGEKERNGTAHMRDERAILNALFRLAVRKRWIKEWQVPNVNFKSVVIPKGRSKGKAKEYTYFTPVEYEFIKTDMKKWAHQPVKFQYRRLAAYYYVMMAFNCGVRPGTGIDSLRWKDVKIVSTDGNLSDEEKAIKEELTEEHNGWKFEPDEQSIKEVLAKRRGTALQSANSDLDNWRLEINVPTSKVGTHFSIGLKGAVSAIEEYKLAWLGMAQTFIDKQERRAHSERKDIPLKWDDDDPLFLLPNGYQMKGSNASDFFKQYLHHAGLTHFEGTKDRRTLYSTRHSFITMLIEKGIPPALIASFAGTSEEMLKDYYLHSSVVRVGREFTDYVVSKI